MGWELSISQGALLPVFILWEGNRRSGIILAVHRRLMWAWHSVKRRWALHL